MKLTPAHFWTWQSWTLLGVNVAVNTFFVYRSLKTRLHRKLSALQFMALFCLFIQAADILIALFFKVDAYKGNLYRSDAEWNLYWTANVEYNILIAILCVQIALQVFGLKYVVGAWAVLAGSFLAVIGYRVLPGADPGNMLMYSTLGSVIAASGLVMAMLAPRERWLPFLRRVAIGVVAYTGISAVCSTLAAYLHNLSGVFYYGESLASAISTCFYVAALYQINGGGKSPSVDPI